MLALYMDTLSLKIIEILRSSIVMSGEFYRKEFSLKASKDKSEDFFASRGCTLEVSLRSKVAFPG